MELSNYQLEELVFILVGLLIISMNFAEVVFILRIKHRSTFEKLLLSLALSDVLVGIAVVVFKVLDFILGDQSWLREENFIVVFIMSALFSLKNLLVITIDRFIAVKFPIKHRLLVTGRRVNILIVLIWVVTCLLGIVLNLILILGLHIDTDYFMLLSSILIISWGVLMPIFYGCILKVVFTRQTAAKMNVEDSTVPNRLQKGFRGLQKSERTVLFSSVLVSVSFVICTYPFAIEYIKTNEDVSLASSILMISNSILNPIIYFFSRFLGQSSRSAH